MTVRNLVVNYPVSSTVSGVLTALKEAMTSTGAFAGAGLGMTLLEDSISGSNLFVVQAQQPTEPLSQMIIEVKYSNILATDYIGFVVWRGWTPGSPGAGVDSVLSTDISTSSTTSPTGRFHIIDLTNGGNFYLDGEDVTGLWFSAHSDRNIAVPVVNPVGHFVSVCSIEKSLAEGNSGVNYGVFSFADDNGSDYLVAQLNSNVILWTPPKNHDGFTDNSVGPHVGTGRASYDATVPLPWRHGTLGQPNPITGRTSGAQDTYNDGEIIWPIYIGNMTTHRSFGTPVPAGSAFGFRGICHGIFGYAVGALVGWRSIAVDDATSKDFLIYSLDGSSGSGTIPKLAVEKA